MAVTIVKKFFVSKSVPKGNGQIALAKIKAAKEMRSKIKNIENFLIFERVTGVEPVSRPWEGHIIPIYDTRLNYLNKFTIQFLKSAPIFFNVLSFDKSPFILLSALAEAIFLL